MIVENLVGGAGVGFPIDSRRIEEIERAQLLDDLQRFFITRVQFAQSHAHGLGRSLMKNNVSLNI